MKRIKNKEYAVESYKLTWREKYLTDLYYERVENDDTAIKFVWKVKLIPYIILFIPVHIFQIFELIWDGGLKNFGFETRNISEPFISHNWEVSDTITGGIINRIRG